MLLAIYGLLAGQYRPSRALLVLGGAWATSWTLLVRTLASAWTYGSLGEPRERRLLIVGSVPETERTLSLLQRAGAVRNYLGRIASPHTSSGGGAAGGSLSLGGKEQLRQLARLYRVEELIFCAADLTYREIQAWMAELGPGLEYRILPEGSDSLIGSHHRRERGTLYTVDINLRLSDPTYRRAKWLFDRLSALILLLCLPLLVWGVHRKGAFIRNVFATLIGRSSWVGYRPDDPTAGRLPALPRAVLYPGFGSGKLPPATPPHLNLLYARDYSLAEDWRIFRMNFRQLGSAAVSPPGLRE